VGRARAGLKIEIVVADECEVVDADQVANAVVEHLKTHAVTRWAAEVEAAVAAARTCRTSYKRVDDDPKRQEKDRLRAQIAELTRKLQEQENEIDSD
jgi:hypothetical protein